MTEKEALQSAGSEARKAAVSARECAEILDEYAASLSNPAFMSRAFELRKMLHDKLAEIALAVHASDQWRLGR
ncbi:MAG: hypothetical protein M3R15_24055 [Acidobacteriota bacterium]|nr:hypothetical protein [Acidobacteriota bacterium]